MSLVNAKDVLQRSAVRKPVGQLRAAVVLGDYIVQGLDDPPDQQRVCLCLAYNVSGIVRAAVQGNESEPYHFASLGVQKQSLKGGDGFAIYDGLDDVQ